MDLNPIDAFQGAESAVLRKKRQLVKYIATRGGSGQNSMVSGTGERRPRQYSRGSKRTPFGR